MLKLIPNKLLGVSIQMALMALFVLWPFFDTKEEENILKRPLLLVCLCPVADCLGRADYLGEIFMRYLLSLLIISLIVVICVPGSFFGAGGGGSAGHGLPRLPRLRHDET